MVWTTIPDSDIDPDSPITTGLMTALRDNPIAIANQDSGAPALSVGASEGASMVLIATQTASSSASIDFTSGIDGTYDQYMVTVSNMHPASSSDLYVRLSQSGSFITGSSYGWSRFEVYDNSTTAAAGSNADAQFRLAANINISNSQDTLNARLYFSTPDNASDGKQFWGDVIHPHTSHAVSRATFGGIHTSLTAMDGVQFIMSTGDIASGVFRLYGIKDS